MTGTPPNPPPGYYPDGSGSQRWWDGNGWTDHLQPAAQATPTEPRPVVSAASPRETSTNPRAEGTTNRPWFKKKRIIIPGVLVALVLIAGGIGAASESGSNDARPSEPAAAPAKDSDNDGVVDADDAFPSDPAETEDQNENGVGDVADQQAVDDLLAKQEKEAAQKEEAERKKEIANAEFVTERDLARVFKDPDARKGDLFKVWGEVTQFDAATGTTAFLANTAHADTRSYGYFDGENALFMGDEDRLDKIVEGDIFVATVEVTGSNSYDTQVGGNTTVPQFEVLKIERR